LVKSQSVMNSSGGMVTQFRWLGEVGPATAIAIIGRQIRWSEALVAAGFGAGRALIRPPPAHFACA
jgi:hypothetical protein